MERHNEGTSYLELVVDNTKRKPARRHRRNRKAHDGTASTQSGARPLLRLIGLRQGNETIELDEGIGGKALLDIGPSLRLGLQPVETVDSCLNLGERTNADVGPASEITDGRGGYLGASSHLSVWPAASGNDGADTLCGDSYFVHSLRHNVRKTAQSRVRNYARAEIRTSGYPSCMERTFQELISELLRAVKGGRNLHKRTGISPTQLEAWGRGTSPTVAKVELAAKNLGISPAALLGYEPLPYWFLEDFQGLRKPDDIEAEIEHAAYIVRMAEARAEEAKSKLFALLDRRAEVRREALRAEQDAAHEAVTEVTAPKARQRHSKGKPSLNRQTG